MKYFIFLTLFSGLAFAHSNKLKKVSIKETTKNEKKVLEKMKAVEKEDCDDKAKKQVEIKPEAISLIGNTGCSLDEAH
jgi:hypothetical protein